MKIIQPKDMNSADGSLALKWNKSFGAVTAQKVRKAQEFIDSECIRLMKPYTPFRNGFLEKSATLGTVIGSGEIHQIAPYARYLYYGEVYGPNIPVRENGQIVGYFSPKDKKKQPIGRQMEYDTTKHPQAGKMWFERMKADHKEEILQGAAEILGGAHK